MTSKVRPSAAGYTFRSFRAGSTASGANAETTAWLEAAALGFQEPVPAPGHLLRTAQVYESDDRTLSGAYATNSPVGAWDSARPVATYASFVESLNVGGGRSLDAHLITSVTVRPNHRRRGLMRELMTADLIRARGEGRAVVGNIAAWSSASGAARADALSTAFMVMSIERIGILCKSHHEVGAIILTRDGISRFNEF